MHLFLNNDNSKIKKIPVVIRDMSLCGLRIEVNCDIDIDSTIMVELILKEKIMLHM